MQFQKGNSSKMPVTCFQCKKSVFSERDKYQPFLICVKRASLCCTDLRCIYCHYGNVTMASMASQITSLRIVYSTVYLGADQRKYQSSAWLAFVRGIHRWPVNSPHKQSVMRKMFPFDDVIMWSISTGVQITEVFAFRECMVVIFDGKLIS